MSDYVVNVNDPTTPTEQQAAKHGAEELRAIKALLVSLIVAGSASAAPRQTVVNALKDASGYNAALSAGAGLRVQLTANATDPYQLNYAAGFNTGLAINNAEQIAANNVDIIGADLPLNNTSFLYKTYGATYGSCLVPPDYGYTFDRTRGALLNFEGNDGSNVFLDDFGNTWAAVGNAQIDTAQFKFGTASLLLDGTGDYSESVNFTSLGDGSWEISTWFRLNATNAFHVIFAAENAAGFGVVVDLDHNVGNRRVRLLVSSNGTANDIASTAGATTTIALNTWYKVRAVFDALAGTYKLYLSNNGAAETQEVSVVSTARVCAITRMRNGFSAQAGLSAFNGWIDAFRFIRCATNTTTEVPAVAAPIITDHRYHFFSIPDMKMYEATAASASAGQNPTLTAATRLFLGEADTSGVAVTAVRNYAIRGEFIGEQANVATGQDFNHNIGVIPQIVKGWYVFITSEAGWNPNAAYPVESIGVNAAFNDRPLALVNDNRNLTRFLRNASPAGYNRATGAGVNLTDSKLKLRCFASRGW